MNNIVDAIIEIPLGTKNKYELDKKINKIRLSRVQYSSMTYPSEYGYIDETLAGDGDPVDILDRQLPDRPGGGDAGVGYSNIDLAEVVQGKLQKSFHVLCLGDISALCYDGNTDFLDLRLRGCKTGRINVVDDDFHAAPCALQGDCLSDSAAGTSYN